MSDVKSVLITGANGGLGQATVHELLQRNIEVVATVRTPQAQQAVQEAFPSVRVLLADLERGMVSAEVEEQLRRVDGLINNAGVAGDLHSARQTPTSVLSLDWTDLQKALWINAEAARRLMAICVPAMLQRNFGRIVNVSSARAALTHPVGADPAPVYDLSKLLLNGITARLGEELAHTNVLVNSLCPGWCQTAMGGPQAPDTPQMGAQRIVRLLWPTTNGKFFINDQVVPF